MMFLFSCNSRKHDGWAGENLQKSWQQKALVWYSHTYTNIHCLQHSSLFFSLLSRVSISVFRCAFWSFMFKSLMEMKWKCPQLGEKVFMLTWGGVCLFQKQVNALKKDKLWFWEHLTHSTQIWCNLPHITIWNKQKCHFPILFSASFVTGRDSTGALFYNHLVAPSLVDRA